jgi:hypothetical protein
MKKSWWILLVIVICAVLLIAANCAAQRGGRGMGALRGVPRMPEAPRMRMTGPVMGRGALAVATDGVYVLAGGTLLKYDRDLKLLRQTELPMPQDVIRPMRAPSAGGGPPAPGR